MIKLNENTNVDEFLDIIFNNTVTIYEDIQGSRLYVKYDGKNFEFRAKSISADPISLVDLSLQKFYNKALNFFYSLDKRVLGILPRNWFFQFEYFPDYEPANISYHRTPKNNLILTGISKGLNNFKYNIEELIEFSSLLDVDPLPVIYYGKLNNKQKEAIRYFLSVSKQDLDYIFGESNFAQYFYNLLSPDSTHSFLMEDEFQNNLEKLIIRVSNREELKFSILNPLYTRNNTELNDTKYVSVYTLLILNFLEYITGVDFSQIKVSGTSKDEMYVDLICRLFNMYMADNMNELRGLDFDIPRFFDKDKYNINIGLIPNSLTVKYISNNNKISYLFKSILGSFRYKKSKPIGLFTEDSLSLFNDHIEKIDTFLELCVKRYKEDVLRNTKALSFKDYYDLKIDIDGDGKSYPDVYTDFSYKDTDTDFSKKGGKKFSK